MNIPAIDNARLFASLDSFEGVPDFSEPRARHGRRAAWRHWAYDALVWLGAVSPGIVLAAGLAFLGMALSNWFGTTVLRFDKSPVSPIMLAVVLGLLIRNTIGVPTAYEQGLRLCIKTVLRLGIVLLGLGLSVKAVATIGLIGLPIIIVCIATAVVAVSFINRVLGLPRRLGTLIAVGTSICGVSAIVATGPAIDAEDDEMSYAVGCVTLFGLIALFAYPFIAYWLFAGDPAQAGLFLGTSIHDTSQVAGAGLMYNQQYGSEAAMKTAMVVKLVRNLCMAALIPLMAAWYHRSGGTAAGSLGARARLAHRWHHMVPLFVIGFALMACLRSLGDAGDARAFGFIDRGAWETFLARAALMAVWCLAVAMAAVGLGTGLARLRGLGWKPFTVGFAAALLVGGVSVVLIKLLVPWLIERGGLPGTT